MLLKIRYRSNEVEHRQVTRKQAQYRKGVYCNACVYVALSWISKLIFPSSEATVTWIKESKKEENTHSLKLDLDAEAAPLGNCVESIIILGQCHWKGEIFPLYLLTLWIVYKGIKDISNNGADASELVRENFPSHIAKKIIAIFLSNVSNWKIQLNAVVCLVIFQYECFFPWFFGYAKPMGFWTI